MSIQLLGSEYKTSPVDLVLADAPNRSNKWTVVLRGQEGQLRAPPSWLLDPWFLVQREHDPVSLGLRP